MIMTKVHPPPSLSVWPKLTSLPISVTSLVAAGCPLLPRNRRPRLQELLNLRKSLFWIWRKVKEFFCRKGWGKVAPVCMNFSIWVLASEICIYIGEKAISCYLLAVQTSSIGDLATAQSLRVFTFTFDRPLRHFVSQNWKQQFTKR